MSTANASRRTLLGWMLAAAVVPVVSVVSRSDAAAPRVIPMRARRFVFIPIA
jgi:cytochrome c oxidase subunit 2